MATALRPTVQRSAKPVTPDGLWLKTHLRMEGEFLHGTTYLSVAGHPEIINVKVSLREIDRMARKYHAALHSKGSDTPKADRLARRELVSGCVGCEAIGYIDTIGECVGCDETDQAIEIGRRKRKHRKGIFRIAKLKVIAKTFNKIRKVMNKIVKPLLMVAAVVYPPVGAPALAAFTTTNLILDKIEKGANAANAAGKFVKHGLKLKGKLSAKLMAKAVTKGLVEKHGKVKVLKSIGRIVQKQVKSKLSKKGIGKFLKKQAVNAILGGRQNRELLKGVIKGAKSGIPKDAKKAHIFRLVAAHKRRLRRLGLGIDQTGNTGLGIKVSGAVTFGGT